MNNSKELFLDEVYTIDGVEVTGEEIKLHKIAFELLKKQQSQ